MLLDHFGITSHVIKDLSNFDVGGENNILLLDGDGACYAASAGAMKPDTAMRRFERAILEAMFLAKCNTARVHLTPSGCFKNGRHLLLGVKPYQDNRGKDKKPPFLEYLRSSASVEYFDDKSDITVILNYEIEADDALMQDHYRLSNGILVSPDKDLLISPKPAYSLEDGKFLTLNEGDTFGWIERKHWLTPSGTPSSKMIGKGHKFFLAQMLMGDVADNVVGIRKLNGRPCGEAGAFNALNPIKDMDEAVNFVIDAYKKIDQNIAPEAEAMWLTRHRGDTALTFLSEADLTDSNLDYLSECYYNRKWRLTEEEYNELLSSTTT